MQKRIHLTIIFLLLGAFYATLKAQEDCAFTLSRAQRLFDAGNIEQIPQMLAPCMENGFTAEEKQQAQKLIILSYLFDKNDKEAEKTMLSFLRKYPEYELNPSDQAEFVQLFKSYLTLPVVSVGVIGGFNTSLAQQGEIFEVGSKAGSFSSSSAYQGGLSFQIYLKDYLDLNVEAIYLQSKLNYKNDSAPGYNSIRFEETRTTLSIPVSAIYTPIHLRKVNPFLRIGLNFDYLLSSSSAYTRTNPFTTKPFNDPDFKTIDNRNKFQVQALGGIGFTYKLKQSFILFEARYHRGFMSQTKNMVQLDAVNQDSWALYYIAENDYSLSYLTFNVGLFYKFYKPRKK